MADHGGWEVFGQRAGKRTESAITPVEIGLDILDEDLEHVARLGIGDSNRPGQDMRTDPIEPGCVDGGQSLRDREARPSEGMTSGPPETHWTLTRSPDSMVRTGAKAASNMPKRTVSGVGEIVECGHARRLSDRKCAMRLFCPLACIAPGDSRTDHELKLMKDHERQDDRTDQRRSEKQSCQGDSAGQALLGTAEQKQRSRRPGPGGASVRAPPRMPGQQPAAPRSAREEPTSPAVTHGATAPRWPRR